MTSADRNYFERAVKLAQEALERGDDGFASVLVDPAGKIVMEESNRAVTRNNPLYHDTMLLVHGAAARYSREFLGNCTVYAVLEPCVMCTAAAFWVGIKNIKFAMAEEELGELLPGGLSISSREFARRSPSPMVSAGPYQDIQGARDVVRAWAKRLTHPREE